MSINLIDNFKYKSTRPNFDRDSINTKEEMLNMDPSWYDDGHIVYCKEDEKHYVFRYNEDTKNEETGYFEELRTGSGEGDIVINGDIIKSDVWVSDEEPPSNEGIWLDTGTEDSGVPVDELASMQNAIYALQQQVNMLLTLKTSGVIAGSLADGARQTMMRAAEPVIPDIIKDEYEEIGGDDSMEELEPDYDEYGEPTTTHISVKTGTWSQLQSHLRDLVNSELVWCKDKNKLYIYQNGILYAVGSGTSGGVDPDNPGGSGGNDDDNDMDKDQVIKVVSEQLQKVESIGFIPVGSEEDKYTVKVNEDGKLICYNNALDNMLPTPTQNYYFSDSKNMSGVLINSYYLGGTLNDEHSYQPCSHNFVELSNVWVDGKGKQKDINLNGLYLLYLSESGQWEKLKLWGTIPAGGTFLIRGAQCSVMGANTTVIKVRDYDMQWFVEVSDGVDDDGNFKYKKELIKFSQNSSVFYLAWANADGKFYELGSSTPVDLPSATTPLINVDNNDCALGYVDLSSFNNSVINEDGTYTLPVGRNASEVIFRRWYPLDMVTQSNPDDGVVAHSTKKYLTSTYLNAANISECLNIEEYTPKCSWQGKTIANTRSIFEADKPSILTNTYGIQATDNGQGASRGFCWVSVGYYDEYICIRKQGETEWQKFESCKGLDMSSQSTSGIHYAPVTWQFSQYYTRMRWETSYGQSVTTHKIILHGLKKGKYEYKIERKGDSSYAVDMPIRKFTVYSDAEAKDFTFIQTTDQQGATWEEYEVWNLSARIMAKEIEKSKKDGSGTIPEDYRFVINTGDICYNGSRSNEWIDYFRGYEPLCDREEMLTIGNNDLIPISIRDLGNGGESPWKINPYIHDYFYTVEIDPENPPIFTDLSDDGSEMISFKIPSLYSFNFGEYHFVSVLSEMRTISNKITVGDNGSSSTKKLSESTVNSIFGIKDELRKNDDGSENPGASKIYDMEEEWMIKDVMRWKGIEIPENFDRNENRYHEGLLNACNKCIVFTHEMPFNIISDSSYSNYQKNADAPRETAKAYLNRYHNFEYQRLWKLWGIMLVLGGHKHTCALTRPVYDAPLTYNPITKQIADRGPEDYKLYSDDILNDIIKYIDKDSGEVAWDRSGVFSKKASFQPFTQLYADEFLDLWNNKAYNQLCNEVYNSSSQDISFSYRNNTSDEADLVNITLKPGEYITDGVAEHPKCRIEIVDNVNTPSYIMCQATGFKNKSNSDLASKDIIPWERFYVKGDNIEEQCYPYYTVYNVKTNTETNRPEYHVNMYKISGMYASTGGAKNGSPVGYWNLAEVYKHGETIEENRAHYVNSCQSILYNTGGTVIK